jgi:hypothetical protein
LASATHGQTKSAESRRKNSTGNGVDLKVGREFWEFISGDPNCLAEVLDLAAEAAEQRTAGSLSFADRVDKKVAALTTDFIGRYGPSLDANVWKRFLADNS